MKYFIGIDSGGTKTDLVLFSEEGRVLARCLSNGGNSQIVGMEKAAFAISHGINRLLQDSGLGPEDIQFLFAGIAGADLPSDFQRLEKNIKPLFMSIPSAICNDTWIALASANTEEWGAVSICGTGHNIAHCTRDGRCYCPRGLQYELGNWGGAIDLTADALNCAFRSEEYTGEYTLLQEKIPSYLGLKSMDELVKLIYIEHCPISQLAEIARLVFELACEGDQVCICLLRKMGQKMGDMLGRYIQHNEPDPGPIPVVLAGSLYQKAECTYLSDAAIEQLKKFVPHAKTIISQSPPVVGACVKALQKSGYTVNEKIRMTLHNEIMAKGR